MTKTHSNQPLQWQPLHFLAALGAGGLAVTFFMYIMWLTPHAGQPIPSFATLVAAFGSGSLATKALIGVSVAGIALFSALHIWLLSWNVSHFRNWHPSEIAHSFKRGNAGSAIMAVPLTYAMAVNVLFIAGAVFVPQLWEHAEYLFPFALLAFGAIGIYALRIFADFISTMLVEGGFDCAKNNSLSQMLSVFAFAMVGVGFSAATAMSHTMATATIGFMGAAFFIITAVLFAAIFLVMGFRSMFEHKANPETVPTLWVIIPFVTVVGIALYRMNMSLEHNFGGEWLAADKFSFLTMMFAIQVIFGVIGYAVMKRTRYFETYVSGPARSPGSFALICPGVALFVFANFVINPGLVGVGALTKFSAGYIALYLPLVALQLVTIKTFFQLVGKLVTRDTHVPASLAPAE